MNIANNLQYVGDLQLTMPVQRPVVFIGAGQSVTDCIIAGRGGG